MATKNKKTVREETITLGVDYVTSENPRNVYGLYQSEFANPNPENFKRYLEDLRHGLNFFPDILFQHVRRRYLHLKSVCQTRKLPIIAKEFKIEAEGDTKEKASEATQFIRKMFLRDESKGFPKTWFIQFISDIVEAQISGLSIFEINYGIEGNYIIIDRAKLIPNYLTIYSDKEDKYYFLDVEDNDVFKMRNLGYTVSSEDRIDINQVKKIDLPEIKKLEVHSLDGTGGNGLLNGFIDGLLWAYMKWNYTSKDWALFLEKFATPPVSASYDPLLADASKSKALEAVKLFGRSKYSVYPNGIEFKIHDDTQKGQTSVLFKDFITEVKEEISIAILGQSLTTSVGQRGTQALGTVHDKVRSDIQHSDMILVTCAVNDLIDKLIDLNFPGLENRPRFNFVAQVDQEYKKAVAVMIRDLRVAGFKAKAEELSAIFGMSFEETTAVGAAVDESDNNDNKNNKEPEEDPEEETKEPEEEPEEDTEKMKLVFKEINKKETEAKIKRYIQKIYNENK